MRTLIATLFTVCVLAPQGAVHNPFGFFNAAIDVSPADLDRLRAGVPLVRFLPASGREIGAFTATAVSPEVTVDRAAAWMRHVELLRENRYVIASQRLSTPPRLCDFDRLTLDDDDLEAIRRCVPGRCGVKLSEADMQALTAAAVSGGRQWQTRVQQTFRARLLQRARAFSAGGLRALDEIVDKKHPSSPSSTLASLIEHTAFLEEYGPGVGQRPGVSGAANGESFLYWSKERLGGKPVITLTHVRLMNTIDGPRPPLVMVGTQLYASHYLDASLTVTAFVTDEPNARAYFVYLHRSSVDLLSGFWGGIARSIIESRVRKDGPAILRSVSNRLAAGEPPRTSVRHAWPSR